MENQLVRSATVSVVVVNFNGLQHLENCFHSLLEQDYPAHLVELIMIDNGSTDGSRQFVAERFPSVRIVKNDRNVGFAPAVNQGARIATGQYLALVNNDMRFDRSWITAMVTALEAHRDRGVVCVGSQILDWEGKHIDFISSGTGFIGFGYQLYHNLPIRAIGGIGEHEALFACGGAMLVDRTIFLETGGFDEDFFAYYEDVDFGWRLWLMGYRVLITPAALVYHQHHGTSRRMHKAQILKLYERNALMMIIKNYEEANLYRVLSAALILMFQRVISSAHNGVPWEHFDPGTCDPQQTLSQEVHVPTQAFSPPAAMKDIFDRFPDLWAKRQYIQARRVRADAEIVPLFLYPYAQVTSGTPPLFTHMFLEKLGIGAMLSHHRKRQVLIVSGDPITENLSGIGIRAVELARGLCQVCDVTLAAPESATLELRGVRTIAFERHHQETLERLVRYSEIIIVQGFTLHRYPIVGSEEKYVVIDLYDPYYLEGLALFSKEEADHHHEDLQGVLNTIAEQLHRGDFFLCASERQRDFWIGALMAIGRLSLPNYAQDPTFRSLIDIVPFGCPETPPLHTRRVLKGVVPGIAETDTVVLWGGGIWDWLDPLTVIRAMAIVRDRRPDMKLFFMGHSHPNKVDVPTMKMYDQALVLARELDLLGQNVFFNDHWVPYSERANYLLEADVGVSAHFDHLETHFAFRTRVLDYIWSGLPIVTTAGDVLADAVKSLGLGYVVPIGNAECFAQALLDLASQPQARQHYAGAFASARDAFSWQRALKPLIAFCTNPHYAADRVNAAVSAVRTPPKPQVNREAQLEAIIVEKNAHIARLEDLIRRLESGRVMRLLSLIERLRRPRRTTS